jgi:transposase
LGATTCRSEWFVTLIIDLTPADDQSGPARLLDLVPGRSAAALADWLAAQPADFAAQVEVVAIAVTEFGERGLRSATLVA